MPNIALLDVDMTLVDNGTSEYNNNLIEFLKQSNFKDVYLVTGRNTNDLWQHVLQKGRFPNQWRRQLLHNICAHLVSEGIQVAGVSTPYDHYLHNTQEASSMFHVKQAGEFFKYFYGVVEKNIEQSCETMINANLLVEEGRKITGDMLFPDGLGDLEEDITYAMNTYLMVTNDCEKKGQLEFLFKQIEERNNDELNLFFFDDKIENLQVATSVFHNASRVKNFSGFEVQSVQNYCAPEITESIFREETKKMERDESGFDAGSSFGS